MFPRIRFLAVLSLFCVCTNLSAADKTPSPFVKPELSSKIGASNVTYLQVLREVFPDLTADGKTQQMKPRRKEIETFGGGEDDATGPGTLPMLDGLVLSDAGKSYAVVLVGEAPATLVLAQVLPTYQFLDAIDVAQDAHVNLSTEFGVLPLKPGVWGFGILSWHLNAGENYENFLMIGVLDGKLHVLYDGPFLYNFMEPGNGTKPCRVEQDLTPPKVAPTQHAGMNDITMAVTEKRLCGADMNHEKAVSQRNFSAVLTWDPAKKKYMGGMKDLYLINKKRVGM